MADDLMQMQRQAARRVQQMQEHSRRVFEEHQGRTAESLEAARTPGWWRQQEGLQAPGLYARTAPPEPPVPTPPAPPVPSPVATLPLPNLDKEQWMLLGLALLLFRSGCRTELLLALLYLAF